jgi:hypothetical protein
MYIENFLSTPELKSLISSVIESYDPAALRKSISLKNSDELINKITRFFAEEYGVQVKLWQSFIFLANASNMASEATEPDQGWHTDGSCQIFDGDCYNVWIPIYNDAVSTGIEVIPEKGNEELYAKLGDPTYPVIVYHRGAAPWVFDILKEQIPPETDMLLVKTYNGAIIPVAQYQVNMFRVENPEPGSMSIFKQWEVHRGFNDNGIRIQLVLKFQDVNAKLNTKPSNNLYKLFETFTQGKGGFDQYIEFMKMFMPKEPNSEHGILEKDLLMSLLKNSYKELN